MISIIIIIALFIIFLFKYIRLKNQICIDNLDNRINELREKYKRMLKDNRLSIDLCTKKSKIGSIEKKILKVWK